MANYVAEIISDLERDSWRAEQRFSPDMENANEQIWNAGTEKDAIDALNNWLKRFQPCLFGRIAATSNLLSYCVLRKSELVESDEYIANRIQDARLRWLADAYNGNKSGFVILLTSDTIAMARPDEKVKSLAIRLCSLYLERDVRPDEVYLDEILLRKPGQQETLWRWDVGVNYFASQGDGRWWNDHRIPGGMGFSMNSVGHMVKAAQLSKAEKTVEQKLGAPRENWDASNVDSLDLALAFAMRTIANASQTVSGKATELLPLPSKEALPVAECPFNLPADLQGKNFCEYKGHYHTDYTIPSEYFTQAVERPSNKTYALDFTYLFRDSIDNPAFKTMGVGRRVKTPPEGQLSLTDEQLAVLKRARMSEQEVPLRDCQRLLRAINT
jgi:hypothetical protein